LEKQLDRCYTNLLRRAQNFSQRDHAMLERVYGGLTTLSLRLKQKHLQFAGHCYGEIISSLILWCPMGKVHSHKLKDPKVIVRDSGRLDTRDLSELWCLGRNLQECAVCSGS